MTKTTIMSPSAAAQLACVDPELDAARIRLNGAISRSGGRAFTYAATFFQSRVGDILISELRSAGWKVRFVPDSRDGSYYEISP